MPGSFKVTIACEVSSVKAGVSHGIFHHEVDPFFLLFLTARKQSQKSVIICEKKYQQWNHFQVLAHSPENSITKYGEGAADKWPRNGCPWMALLVPCPSLVAKRGGVRHYGQLLALAASSSAPCTLRTRRFCLKFEYSHVTYYQVKCRTEKGRVCFTNSTEKMEVLRGKCFCTYTQYMLADTVTEPLLCKQRYVYSPLN